MPDANPYDDLLRQRDGDQAAPTYSASSQRTQLTPGLYSQERADSFTPAPIAAPVAPSITGASGAALPGASGPTATGHINFDQIYNANAATSARRAGEMQNAALAKGQAARTGMVNAQNTFNNDVRAGTIKGPTQQQRYFAQFGGTGVQLPMRADDPGYAHNNALPSQNAQPLSASDQATLAGIQSGAGSASGSPYTGPNSLSEMDVYGQLTKDAADAQDMSTSLAAGNEGIQAQGLNQLDAALVGASGRRGFEELGKEYGGLKGELEKANADSVATAKAAKEKSTKALDAYRALAGEYEGRVAGDKAKAKEIEDYNANHKTAGVNVIPQPDDDWMKEQGLNGEGVGFRFYKGASLDDAKRRAHDGGATFMDVGGGKFGGDGVTAGWSELNGGLFSKDDMKKLLDVINENDWAKYQEALSYGPRTTGAWIMQTMDKYGLHKPGTK